MDGGAGGGERGDAQEAVVIFVLLVRGGLVLRGVGGNSRCRGGLFWEVHMNGMIYGA